jgi:hypothetical protein
MDAGLCERAAGQGGNDGREAKRIGYSAAYNSFA